MRWIFLAFLTFVASKTTRETTHSDDYTDFSSQSVQNGGANHQLKQVTYSTIAPKLEIPTRPPTLSPRAGQPVQTTTKKPVYDYRRGYFFQHYPWDRLPRRYLLRPGMTYVYPPQYQYANYRYPYLGSTYSDPYNIYKSHPGIGYGCGGGSTGGGCGGSGGYGGYSGYGGYASQSGGCGGGGGGACSGGNDEEYEDSYEDSDENGKSGETKINKKDPLEDLELEDLEKLSKATDESKAESKQAKASKGDDEDLAEERKKKKQFLVKWA